MQTNRWLRHGVALWAALLFALLALVAAPGRAHAQADDLRCPYARRCPMLDLLNGALPAQAEAAAAQLQPAPQGNFTRAAFASLRDGNFEIYVAHGDGTQAINITHNGAADWEPQLSPDGAQVVFSSDRDHLDAPANARIFNLYIVNIDGTGLRRLTATGDNQARPVWSPDGSRIAFTMKRNNNIDVYTIQRDGTGLQRLTNGPTPDFDPAYTFDGRAIYWVHIVETHYGYFIRANADGSNPVQISNPHPYPQHPAASPNGEFIAYELDEDDDGGWLEVRLGDPSNLSIGWVIGGAPLRDVTVAGWSPALINTPRDYAAAITELSLFYTTWFYEQGPTEGDVELASVYTQGYLGWAHNRPVHSSAFDFGFHAVALDRTAPTITVAVPPLMPRYATGLTWRAADTGIAGMGYLELDIQKHDREYLTPILVTKFITQTWGNERVDAIPGYPTAIRVRARDFAGNVSAWTTPVTTTLYATAIAATLTDARGNPVARATLSVDSHTPIFMQPSSNDGVARIYLDHQSPLYSLRAAHPAYGEIAFPSWYPWHNSTSGLSIAEQGVLRTYFRGARNAIHNGIVLDDDAALAWWDIGCGSYVWNETGNTNSAFFLSTAPYCPPATSARVAQAVPAAATAGMYKPTLTFMYKPDPFNQGETGWPLRVLITTAGAPTAQGGAAALTVTPVFTQSSAALEPTLGWADLSPWAGRAITVTFEISPVSGLSPTQAILDEISLTSWETPIVRAASQIAVQATDLETAATLVITGENFMGAPVVQLTGVQTQTLALAGPVTETALRAALPKALAPGRYRVRVTNPGGLYTELDFNVNLPESLYLPILNK